METRNVSEGERALRCGILQSPSLTRRVTIFRQKPVSVRSSIGRAGDSKSLCCAGSSPAARTSLQPRVHRFALQCEHAEDAFCAIGELLTAKELQVEGGIMRHCVATYIHRCAHLRTSIWSMKVHHNQRPKGGIDR